MNTQTPTKKALAIVWLTLVLLHFTILGCAWVGLKSATTPIIISLAITQTVLVMFVFMEVRHSAKLIRFFAAAGFFWLLIQFALVACDYATRIWH